MVKTNKVQGILSFQHIRRYAPASKSCRHRRPAVYSLALVWAFFMMGSILVAFMMSPLILSLPDMKSFWALALPATRSAKSASESCRVTGRLSAFCACVAFSPLQIGVAARMNAASEGADEPLGLVPRPLPTLPVSLRSMCHDSVSPPAFLRVKAKVALAWEMASLRSSSLELSVSLMTSKAAEAGNLSAGEASVREGDLGI